MKAHKMRWIFGLMAAMLVASVMAVGCGPTETPAPEVVVETEVVERTVEVPVEVEITSTPTPRGGTLVLASNKYPSGLDPHVNVAWDVAYILGSVYDTLVYQDSEGNFVPGLAEDWDVSDDGTVYTFYLREDVTFHDGTTFDAEAVKYNFDRIVDPDTASQKAAGLLGPFAGSEVVDEYTIEVTLEEPYAYLLHGLSMPYLGMASPEAIEEWGEEYQLHQVGTGPFMFDEFVPQDHLTLVPNPDYNWAPSIFAHEGPAYLDEVRWIFLPEPATRAPALEAGDADIVLSLPASDGNRVANDPTLELSVSMLTGQPLFWFMNTEMPPTDDILVRQALIYGTDRQAAINAVLRGFYLQAHGPLAAASPEFTDAVADMYPYDPQLAGELLDEAGWVDTDDDGIRDKDGEPLTVSMVLQGWGFISPLGELLQAQLRQIGVNVEMEQLSWPGQMEVAIAGERNMPVMGGSGFFAYDALNGFFHSSNAEGGFNWSKVQDPELDALLEAGARALDLEERQEAYGEAQVMIMEQALILPVYDYAFIAGVNSRVQGLSWDSTGLVPYLYDVYVEE